MNLLCFKIRPAKLYLLLFFFTTCFTSLKAATVYFNTVYKGVGNYALNTQSIKLDANKITGSNFSFTDGANNKYFASGNNIYGTFKYYDASGNLQSITGTISRQDKSGNNTLSVYFTSGNTAYLFIIPAKESNYVGSGTYSTSGDPMDAALNNLVDSTPTVLVSSYSLTASHIVFLQF